MAKEADLITIASGYYSLSSLNANFDAINVALNNTLSLDGSTPNSMNADLDMNSNDILNASSVSSSRFYRNGVEMVPSGLTSVEYPQYTHGAVGTVARDVPDRLRDLVFVTDYDAQTINDAATNTPLFQNAIDAGLGVTLLPTGNWNVTVGSLTGQDRATGAAFLGLGATINSADQQHGLRGFFFGPDGIYAESYDFWMNDGWTTGVTDDQAKILFQITSETEDIPSGTDKDKIGIQVSVRARGGLSGDGVRANLENYSSAGGGNTAFYANVASDTGASWSAGQHAEVRHAGGTGIGHNSEVSSYANVGTLFAFVANNTTNGTSVTTHPLTGGAKATHPSVTGYYLQGSAPAQGQFRYGFRASATSMRSNGDTFYTESPAATQFNVSPTAVSATADIYLQADSKTGIILAGTYTTGNAVRLNEGQAIAWENTGAIKQLYQSGLMKWQNAGGERVGIEIDPTPKLRMNGTQVLGERDTGWTAMTGTATKGGFDTSTVTLPQLAQVVKAMLDSDISHGFKGA
jgi:hypothetical protein